jgi:phosphoribosylamine--glycine ligase
MAEVLIIGAGGREEAIRQAMMSASEVENAQIAPDARSGLGLFKGKSEKPFVVIGPEALLVDGLVDDLREDGYIVFGPNRVAAQYEASKSLAVTMMQNTGILHPDTTITNTTSQALEYVESNDAESYVIKADGLAGGKGVVLPNSRQEARAVIESMKEDSSFDGAGKDIINFQERHSGPELSAMAVVGTRDEFVILPLSQDHKRLGEADTGPNTGGMGAYAPVPETIVSKAQYQKMYEIVGDSLQGMRNAGTPYERAVLYVGFMLSKQLSVDPVVIEYNVRFGDPEAQVILPLLGKAGVNCYRLLRSAAEGELEIPKMDLSNIEFSALSVCMAAKGYPENPRKGDKVWGIGQTRPDVTVQKAALNENNETSGGRVLYVTGVGETIDQAANFAYDAIDLDLMGPESGKIGFSGMQLRKDIGYQARAN